MIRPLATSAAVSMLLVAACGGNDTPAATDAAPTTVAATVPTTVPNTVPATTTPEPVGSTARELVIALAADELQGRDNLTAGSVAAQDLLIAEIAQFAQPVYGDGPDGYRQPFAEGVNVIAVIPGGELPDEYVVIGAHYDHIGVACGTADPADQICNGAADNAAGVAVAVAAARALAADGPPRRSVVLALWDAEEDGLLGSAAYVADPPFPLAATVGYINLDIQGANLSPALADTTVVVGAETGGAALSELTRQAIADSPLNALQLSAIFGQGRSDYANFIAAGVPTVFFTDATNGCYHTAQDDLLALNFDKLALQIDNTTALAKLLVATDSPPPFDPNAALTSFNDAVSMLAVLEAGLPDVGLLAADAAAAYEQYRVDLTAIVAAGEEQFDDAAIQTLLLGAITVVDALTQTRCLAV